MTEGEAPDPIVPDFGGACLTEVVPNLLGRLGASAGSGAARAGGTEGGGDGALPRWMPGPVGECERVVLFVLDGLGWEQLIARRSVGPVLASGVGGPITSVAPSTTACALTSLSTGRAPAEHGVVGYRMAYEGQIMNVLQWTLGGADARATVPPSRFQACPTFRGAPGAVPAVTRYDYGPTGFTAAHLGDIALHRWYTQAGLVTGV
ncbi:MAG TPA: alkaline phosphatase family protein, partial [Acidimicrobiales bacterium]|nr:alkaline phosphatase family protein [Acidimicrobiales bacterium]